MPYLQRISTRLLLLFSLCMLPVLVHAQNADDVMRYSTEYPANDPINMVMPGVSSATGFGGYQDNPASMALARESYFSFNLSSRFIDETGLYLGNASKFTDNQTSIGDFGFVYKVPTLQGSLAIGGGYSHTTDFNRAFSVSARNNETTITDFYNSSLATDSLFFAAFDVYAIDFATDDSSFADTKSIFRFFDNNYYPGINQAIEVMEEGDMGEYSAFVATEFLKNFSVGASIGYMTGSYSYTRNFLESDRQDDYNAQFIDTDGDGNPETDIDRILSVDTIDADLEAFSARLGFVYQPLQEVSLGASYEFQSALNVDETYDTELTTTFDNGVQFSDDAPGQFSYKVIRPARANAGLTIGTGNGLRLSASAEHVWYSDARIEFEEIELNPDEEAINGVIRAIIDDVINLRGGLEYNINDRFTPRVGYAYYPDPQGISERDRQFFSGGFSAELTKGLLLDVGVQYSFWEEENELYQTPTISEVVREEVSRIHVMGGLKVVF